MAGEARPKRDIQWADVIPPPYLALSPDFSEIVAAILIQG